MLRPPASSAPVHPRHASSTPLRLGFEPLENRWLMTAAQQDEAQDWLAHGSTCGCPVCTGLAQQQVSSQTPTAAELGQTYPLTSIPALNSLPGARATLFLDFDGEFLSQWGQYRNVSTPVYDRDGNTASFSDWELSSITEIWARTAEDYAPFSINVTTVDPGNATDRLTARIAVGGNWSDWFGNQAGGVAYVGGFYNSAPNLGYVFEDALGNGHPKYVAEAVSHEAGHLFGLVHQSQWSGSTLVSAYDQGSTHWAPIMGVGYYSARTTWNNGATNVGPTALQDDMAILANSSNGFGYRTDDYGNASTSAWALNPSGAAQVNIAGLLGQNNDADWFSFNTGTGNVNFGVSVDTVSSNLDTTLELRDKSGTVLFKANPTDQFGASLAAPLNAGLYYVVVRSSGGYGNVGRYSLTGTVIAASSSTANNNTGVSGNPAPTKASEIDVLLGKSVLSSGDVVDFGTVDAGIGVDRTITVKNTGNATLTLSPLDVDRLPAGFTLISNLGVRNLAPGRSTNFRVRLKANEGSYTGQISIASNDSDEASFIVQLAGTVLPAPLVIDDGGNGFATSGNWSGLRAGRDRDSRWAGKGDGASLATWTFTGLTPGQYSVHATWLPSRAHATNVPFTLLDGATPLTTISVNQERAPTGLNWKSSTWSRLGTVVISGDTLRVQLSNSADERVLADAIRIQRLGDGLGARSLVVDPQLDSTHTTIVGWQFADVGSALQPGTGTPDAPTDNSISPAKRVTLATEARSADPSVWDSANNWDLAPDRDGLDDALSDLDTVSRCEDLLEWIDRWLSEGLDSASGGWQEAGSLPRVRCATLGSVV